MSAISHLNQRKSREKWTKRRHPCPYQVDNFSAHLGRVIVDFEHTRDKDGLLFIVPVILLALNKGSMQTNRENQIILLSVNSNWLHVKYYHTDCESAFQIPPIARLPRTC